MNVVDDGHLTLTDRNVLTCPFVVYDAMREASPAYYDPKGGFYVITRFEDVKRVLMDPARFISYHSLGSEDQRAQAERNRSIFEEDGWVPGPSLPSLNGTLHADIRSILERAFRASKVKEMDETIREEAYELAQRLLPLGGCEIVADFSASLTQRILAFQLGVPREHLPLVKKWTFALVERISGFLTPEQEEKAVRLETEAQQYFKAIIDRVRAEPDGSIISDLVNTPMSDGQLLTDAQLMGIIMLDLFVAGSETTVNAITAGVLRLCGSPELVEAIAADRNVALKSFCEEVLRLDSPVQGLFRKVAQDVELSGVKIPKGAIVTARYAAANRDPRRFKAPERLALDRPSPASHLAFGSGVHHCLGAPLARRELHWAFSAIVDTWSNLRTLSSQEPPRVPHIFFRFIQELHVAYGAD